MAYIIYITGKLVSNINYLELLKKNNILRIILSTHVDSQYIF